MPAGAAGGKIPRGSPDKPARLPAEAAAEWDRITAELDAAGLLSRVDRASLTAYCLAWARMVWADQRLQADGPIISEPIQNATGQVIGQKIKAHPAGAILDSAARQVAAFADRFGLTPAARARLEGDGGAGKPAPAGNSILAIRDEIARIRSGG